MAVPAVAPARRVLALALASRAAILGCMVLSDWAFQDLDSSVRLQSYPCAGSGAAAGPAAGGAVVKGQPFARGLRSLAVWDTAYFARVAKCGYETDKLNAFFPLLPAVMRFSTQTTGLHSWLPAEAAYTLVGLAANLAAFCVAALCLHRLSCRVLANCRLADLSLLLFCFNPASVFYSAAYSEALFTAATWLGLLLLPTHHWAAVLALAAAAAARSNGILGVWFPLHKLLVVCRRKGRLPVGEAARAALSCCVIAAPYVAMQAQAYMAHCLLEDAAAGSDGRPLWCHHRLPSVYGYIQSEYWDVGFLRFYRDPSRLPMVLMSVPVAWLSISGCWAYFAADWQRALTLGLYSRRQRLPHWLAGVAAVLQGTARRLQLGSTWLLAPAKAHNAASTALLRSVEAAPLMYHWALMAAVSLLAMHVNVATRFLSTCPPLYWHASQLLHRGGLPARLIWLWSFAYSLLGCLLFPNFYPWT